MPFPSSAAALQNFADKKHKKNAENLSPYITPKPVDTKDDFRCNACNIIVGSIAKMEAHMVGIRHRLKMKAYLDRMNAVRIAPPSYSRRRCKFTNVEREEAYTVDRSGFTQPLNNQQPRASGNNFIPANSTQSFLNAGRYGGDNVGSDIANRSYNGYAFETTYDNDMEAPDYSGNNNGYGFDNGSGNYAPGFDYPLADTGGYESRSGSNDDESFSDGQCLIRPPPWVKLLTYSAGNDVPYQEPPTRTSASVPHVSPHFMPRVVRCGNRI